MNRYVILALLIATSSSILTLMLSDIRVPHQACVPTIVGRAG